MKLQCGTLPAAARYEISAEHVEPSGVERMPLGGGKKGVSVVAGPYAAARRPSDSAGKPLSFREYSFECCCDDEMPCSSEQLQRTFSVEALSKFLARA